MTEIEQTVTLDDREVEVTVWGYVTFKPSGPEITVVTIVDEDGEVDAGRINPEEWREIEDALLEAAQENENGKSLTY